jgi:hypothetical protein
LEQHAARSGEHTRFQLPHPTQRAALAAVAAVGTAFVYRIPMRCLALIIAAMLLTGCAGRAKTSQRLQAPPEAELVNYWYAPSTASALAFDPPVVASAVTPNLSREGRETTAYVGYDEVITTHFYLRYDDRQVIHGSGPERYERRAISERFGVSYR